MTLEELKEDYDWKEAMGFAPFGMDEIVEILAIDPGENDGQSWVGVFKLSGERWGFVDAWCDYTGWGCQSDGDGYIDDSLENLRRFKMNSSARRRLGMALDDLDGVPNRN